MPRDWTIWFVLAIVLVTWVVALLPTFTQRKKQARFLESLKKGDRVITAGGLKGVITGVKEDTVTLKVAEKVEVQVVKSAILKREE
jgi:preprotein translocase subunit YajC